jgi:hypothetical protein
MQISTNYSEQIHKNSPISISKKSIKTFFFKQQMTLIHVFLLLLKGKNYVILFDKYLFL